MNFFSGFLAGSCINEANSSSHAGNRKSNSLLVHMHLHSLFRLTDGYVYWQDAAWWGAHVLDLNPERLAHSDCHVLIPDSFQLILSCSKHGVLNILRAPQYSFLSINFSS